MMGALLNFTVCPEEMKCIVDTLARYATTNTRDMRSPFFSIMVTLKMSRIGEQSCEAVVARREANVLFDAIRSALDKDNGIGRKVMDLVRQAAFN